MAKSTMRVSPAFDNFIFDWYYEKYLLIGSYGSGKSYAIAEKIIIKLFEEKRKVCIFREVYATLKESTFDLIKEILSDMNLLEEQGVRTSKNKICWKESPMEFRFPNGSRIIFKGMDNADKLRSLNGVSIVWIEECSEITLADYLELLGRIRTKKSSMHFIMSCNPIGKSNWVYRNFFSKTNEDGTIKTILAEDKFYKQKQLVKNGIYYHHSTCEDNPFLPYEYIQRLDEIKSYDPTLWVVARLGRFGVSGLRVLPQFEVMNAELVNQAVINIPMNWHRIGMDFGFETSYNAVIKCAIDDRNKYLYIYKEYYKNHMTDVQTASDLVLWDDNIKNEIIKADCAEPKAIKYYQLEGFKMKACRKLADRKSEGSRIANTKKCKRFHRIICSSNCINTIRELQDLTYKKKNNGDLDFSKFNIDPHTFSAIWYALDDYTVTNYKSNRKFNSKKG